jgi:matrixin
MLRRLTLIALLCLLAIPAAAEASPDPGRDPLVQRWLAVARAHWGASPPCLGGVDAVVGDWGPGGDSWAYAAAGGCWIVLRPTAYPAPAGMDPTWWRIATCSTIAHEWGHLLGHGHSTDPSSLMYPYVPLGAVPGCAPGASPPPGYAPRRRARRCAPRARQAAGKTRRCVRGSDRSRRARGLARSRTTP